MVITDARSDWELACTDAVGRQRVLQVSVTRVGHVALIAPAGESASMPPDVISRLIELLSAARSRALRGDPQHA